MDESLGIRFEGLCKSYGRNSVLENLDLQIPAGRIVGLMGPNGCGKSTLLKIMAGLLTDYSGSVTLFGEKPGVFTKSFTSFMTDCSVYPGWKKPAELIRDCAAFFPDFDARKAEEMMRNFSLDLTQPLSTMSKGMQEKVQLALVMSRRARLFLLDEPLGGIDPATRYAILEMIKRYYLENSTLIISTHLVQDIEPIFNYGVLLGYRELVLAGDTRVIEETYHKSLSDIFKEVFSCLASF